MRNDEKIVGRSGELWFPLLALARFVEQQGCEGLFDRVRTFALKKITTAGSKGLDDWTNALLLGLKDLTAKKEQDISTNDIWDAMAGYYDGSVDFAFKVAKRSKMIGTTVRRFGLEESGKRTNKGYRYIIRHELVVDVILRYGV